VGEASTSGVREFERKQLLERVEREGATVGASIPDGIEVQGERIDLQEFVFEISRRETVPAGERERVERAKKNLRRERLQRKQRIEDGDISREEGERLVEAIIGIDRALNALEGLGAANLEDEIEAKEAADRKRWMNFLRKALGHEDENKGVGTGRSRGGRG
jgi:predicted phage gp36 major capsid-like protein